MKATSRRKLEMGNRALKFSRVHPDASPGYTATMTRFEERLARADHLATQQREGIIEVRAATARKHELRRTMKRAHLNHLTYVAEVAAREVPELAQKFVALREGTPYLAFRTAARSMAAEAEARKELLVKHGLTDTILSGFAEALDQFDKAMEQSTEGRRAHVGASAELEAVADEIVQVVKVLDGLNRFRFANDAESLAAWESASNVFPTPRPTAPEPAPAKTPPARAEVRPAA